MNFSGWQAKYRRLQEENLTWKLLRADNAPIFLAFIADLFAEDNQVAFSRARIALESELERGRELGYWDSETGAGTYLNRWIQAGWLRELDDQLTKTDASERALRFCESLEEHASGTSASHLRIVQEAVRDLAVAISPNQGERTALLEHKKAEIQRQIDDLQAGVVHELSEREQSERIREIYHLASVLTGDFRRVEDDIRQLDKALRIQIIAADATRGDVLQTLMEKEALLANTDAGSAFEGFFQLLCDQNRSAEFRDQLRGILSRPAAQYLKPAQQQYLGQLMRELTRESEHVFHVRRRCEEGLRSYIESGMALENLAVERLLQQLEKAAIEVREAGCDLQGATQLSLDVGSATIRSPDSMRLKLPDEQLDTSGVEEQANHSQPSLQMLDCLSAVKIREIAENIVQCLQQFGPMTIAELAAHHPIQAGLEELVAFLRVAKAISATSLEDSENIEVRDKSGQVIRARIPTYLLSAELFPNNLDELTL